jgi:hypothetical protein
MNRDNYGENCANLYRAQKDLKFSSTNFQPAAFLENKSAECFSKHL